MQITIPHSLHALGEPGGIAALLTAEKWQRAALVYAFTSEVKPGIKTAQNKDELSCARFSKLGIKGLKNEGVVGSYRRRFAEQVEAGTVLAPVPGATIDLSNLPAWEPMSEPKPVEPDPTFWTELEPPVYVDPLRDPFQPSEWDKGYAAGYAAALADARKAAADGDAYLW